MGKLETFFYWAMAILAALFLAVVVYLRVILNLTSL